MPPYSANEAEFSFLEALQGGGLGKEAVELEPDTMAALDIPSVSPSFLDDLESQAEKLQPEPEGGATASAEEAPAVELEQYEQDDTEPAEEAAPEPELPTRASHGKVFSNKRANPLQILDILTMRYKADWPKWESDTLWWALRRDYGPVGEVTRNKIGALRVAVSTDLPWLDWDVFEDSGLAWNDIIPVIGTFQPMSPMQTAFAVNVLRSVRPDEEFTHEVKAYIAAILDDHGFVYAPEEFFDGAQELLDRKQWLVGLKNDVESAWEQIKDVDPEAIAWDPDNPLDVHLLKLTVVQRYLAEREALRDAVPGGTATSSPATPPVP